MPRLLGVNSFGQFTDPAAHALNVFLCVNIAAGALVLHSKHVAAVILLLFCSKGIKSCKSLARRAQRRNNYRFDPLETSKDENTAQSI